MEAQHFETKPSGLFLYKDSFSSSEYFHRSNILKRYKNIFNEKDGMQTNVLQRGKENVAMVDERRKRKKKENGRKVVPRRSSWSGQENALCARVTSGGERGFECTWVIE